MLETITGVSDDFGGNVVGFIVGLDSNAGM
jgi:hypothetical protein